MEIVTPPQPNPTETSENSQTPLRSPDGKLLPGGPSLNPGGRPPQVSITSVIKKMLNEKFPIRKCRCDCHNDRKSLIDNEIIPGKPRTETCFACEALHEEIEEDKELQRTYLDKVARAIFENAILDKDQKSLKDIWAYVDGMPKNSFELGVDREGLVELTEFMKSLALPKPKQ